MFSLFRRFFIGYAENLIISPNPVYINSNGGTALVAVRNNGETRYAFKISCTNNLDYLFSDVYGFFEVGERKEIEITRRNGPAKADYFYFCLVEARPGDNDASELFPQFDYGHHKIKITLEASSSLRETLIATKEPPSIGEEE
uniref:Major sperm protein n=1 Tax=Meloidogyne hapla TaxID=6305 RepID=A0A1I8BTT1_MELHA